LNTNTDRHHPPASLETQLRQVQQATGEQRERLLADFVRSRRGQHRSIAASTLRYPQLAGVRPETLTGLVDECAALLVEEAGTPNGFPFAAYDALLRVAAHRRILDWAATARLSHTGPAVPPSRRRLATVGRMLAPALGASAEAVTPSC